MTAPESSALATLAEVLGATLILPEPCPFCGHIMKRTKSGALPMSAPCTKAGRHITTSDNALRIEFHMTWDAYWAKIERYGTPAQNPRAWVQPQDKARKWQANTRIVGGVLHSPSGTMEE